MIFLKQIDQKKSGSFLEARKYCKKKSQKMRSDPIPATQDPNIMSPPSVQCPERRLPTLEPQENRSVAPLSSPTHAETLPERHDPFILHSLGVVPGKNFVVSAGRSKHVYPLGYKVSREMRSYVNPRISISYFAEVRSKGSDDGSRSPKPLFVITAEDDKDNPVISTCPTDAWELMMKRKTGVHAELRGSYYFGLEVPSIDAKVQSLPGVVEAVAAQRTKKREKEGDALAEDKTKKKREHKALVANVNQTERFNLEGVVKQQENAKQKREKKRGKEKGILDPSESISGAQKSKDALETERKEKSQQTTEGSEKPVKRVKKLKQAVGDGGTNEAESHPKKERVKKETVERPLLEPLPKDTCKDTKKELDYFRNDIVGNCIDESFSHPRRRGDLLMKLHWIYLSEREKANLLKERLKDKEEVQSMEDKEQPKHVQESKGGLSRKASPIPVGISSARVPPHRASGDPDTEVIAAVLSSSPQNHRHEGTMEENGHTLSTAVRPSPPKLVHPTSPKHKI